MTPYIHTAWSSELDSWFRALLMNSLSPIPVTSDENWRQWLTTVRHHNFTPLLYYWLNNQTDPFRPPAWVMDKLQYQHLASQAHAAYRWAETQHLLTVLTKAHIQPVVLKGTALAESHYPSPELRPSLDIDLLIPAAQYPQAKNALVQAGYAPQIELDDRGRQWACEEAFLSTQAPNGRSFLVELHWSLSPYNHQITHPPLAELFQRATAVAVDGFPMPIPNPVDALVHTVLHLYYGHPEDIRLIWLYDVHLLSQQLTETEWQESVHTSHGWQARFALAQVLPLTQKWFGTTYPSFITDLTDSPPTEQETKIQELANYRLLYDPQTALFQRDLQQLENLSPQERLIFLYRRLFPSHEALRLGYPQWRHWPLPLAYSARLLLFFRRYLNLKFKPRTPPN